MISLSNDQNNPGNVTHESVPLSEMDLFPSEEDYSSHQEENEEEEEEEALNEPNPLDASQSKGFHIPRGKVTSIEEVIDILKNKELASVDHPPRGYKQDIAYKVKDSQKKKVFLIYVYFKVINNFLYFKAPQTLMTWDIT